MYHKVLITGGTGFVGKNLCSYLKQQYENIEIFISNSETCNLYNKKEIVHYLSTIKPECIIHLAATCGGIGANRYSPATFMLNNLKMGLNLIESLFKIKYDKKLITLGTICAYPKYCPVPFKENDMWNGYPEETNAPYGIAKKTLTELLIALYKEWGMHSTNLYPTNMYGPYDNFNLDTSHVIPAIILKIYQAITKGENKIELWGTGSPTRDFLYVRDCCRAIDLAMKTETGPKPINIGTGQEYSILDIANKLCQIMNFDGEIIWDANQPDGQPRRCVCYDKAQRLLGYTPEIHIKNGLRSTVDWFLQNVNGIYK